MPHTAAPQDKGLIWGSKPLSILSTLLPGAEDMTALAALPTAAGLWHSPVPFHEAAQSIGEQLR